jgi:uncharacterized LabA/DUF88 family protein
MDKVALFVDWDNLRSTITSIQSRYNLRNFNYNDPKHLMHLFRSYLQKGERFYRIFFYTAKMLSLSEIEDLARGEDRAAFERWKSNARNVERYENKYRLSNEFLEKIVLEDYVALRLGKLRFDGLKNNGYPVLVQKEVDMLFGLDISHVSYLRLADKVMLFSKDSDIVPAMKAARINGLEVILPTFREDERIFEDLLKHSDVRRERSLLAIAASLHHR